ncbi:hypothetical protein C8F04DRAFT_978149 [Mycena alexandri]|uniref:CxC2-like cysteine cluster KDZ transposase-associated domain-containing protein n=1 Tax=Mycena alexandri TaxID=1745969 RepID=A0AAD6S0I2_9AGAR|nr:hypothetical protein C8F04DRAFT_978149 [Mycena alexandri]
MAASFNASETRGSRRNADVGIYYETSSADLSSDRAVYPSQDGRRVTQKIFNIGVKRRCLEPSDLEDSYAAWQPLPDDGPSSLDVEGAGGLEAEGEEEYVDEATGEKRKRYRSSDEPNSLWHPLKQIFLDELLRSEGLGDSLPDLKCGSCSALAPQYLYLYPWGTLSACAPSRFFRCSDCGTFIQCERCVQTCHASQPLHLLNEWNGHFWKDITLRDLKIVFQVGHGGLPCPSPEPGTRTMVVLHPNAVHTVDYRYCKCDLSERANNLQQLLRTGWYPATTIDPATCATFQCLELYRILNVVGNINVHDFVGSLERLTDATKITKIPDRYKAFGCMSRQWAHLMRVKRTGGGHNRAGVAATAKGATALLCWPCPHDEKNIPQGWRDVAPEFKFLYMLILAMDANFRLKNHMRKNEHHNPTFGPGWGYMVEEKRYKKHLRSYVAEKDVSSCIAFAALLQKDTKMTTGLRCSGVGGVVCARHEVVRPQGMGDLQKGERYSNMDYIFLSAILGVMAMYLAVSYDIVCQWQVNLRSRIGKMPQRLQPPAELKMLFGLPIWHASAHESKCATKNSLSYMPGAGKTDGEGIERTWSGLNPAAWATKEMGNGGRHDALEDRIDHHNGEKNIGQDVGDTLARKLVVAIEERDRQIQAFTEVDSTLRSELKKEWQQQIDKWLADRTRPSPYESEGGKKQGPSEATVRRELKKDELRDGVESVYRKGHTAFLVAGMQLELIQYVQMVVVNISRTLLSGDLVGRVEELRVSFLSKLKAFRELQGRHMPGAVRRMEEEEEERKADEPATNPEDIRLWMPSELTEAERDDECATGLGGREAKLPLAQCTNALDTLRLRLHAKRHLISFRNSHVVGQKHATRSSTLIGMVGERIDTIAVKYRRARLALLELEGAAYCVEQGLRVLTGADIRLDEEWESDGKARHRLGTIGSSKHRHANEPTVPSKNKTFSWIWTSGEGPEKDAKGLHEAVRVEWSKARARRDRWVEEVQLLREEMRRVMRFLQWQAAWWEGQREARGKEIQPELAAGVKAYAARQAALHRGIARRFRAGWESSRAAVVRLAVLEDSRILADALEEGMVSFVAAERPSQEDGERTEGEDEERVDEV